MGRSSTPSAVFVQTDPVIVRAVLPLALTVAAADAAPAAGPVLNPLKLCYVSVESSPGTYATEDVLVSGYGFRSSATVDVLVDGELVLTTIVDTSGQLPEHPFSAPVQRAGQRRFAVRVRDTEDRGSTAKQRALVSALRVRLRPRRAR